MRKSKLLTALLMSGLVVCGTSLLASCDGDSSSNSNSTPDYGSGEEYPSEAPDDTEETPEENGENTDEKPGEDTENTKPAVKAADVVVSYSDGGTASCSPTSGNVGDKAIVTFTFDEGFMLESITHNGSAISTDENGAYSFLLEEEKNEVFVKFVSNATDNGDGGYDDSDSW